MNTGFTILITLLTVISVCYCNILNEGGNANFSAAEEAARKYINEIMPTIKKNLDWEAELNFKDRSKISFIDKLGLDHENAEIDYFLTNLTEKLKSYPYEHFTDEDLKRQIKLLIIKDYHILPDKEQHEMEDLIAESSTIHTQIKVCPDPEENSNQCNLRFSDIYMNLYFDINEERLKWYWKEWRDKAGKMRRRKFDRYVELFQKAAELNEYSKPSEMMLNKYEDNEIVEKMAGAIEQVRPLYQKLHAYLRHKLQVEYDNRTSPDREPIPLHLMERFSAEYATLNLLDNKFYPFPQSPSIVSSDKIVAQNYTPIKILSQADEFYKSMGMQPILTYRSDWKEYVQIIPQEGNDETCTSRSIGVFEENSFYFALCSQLTLDNFLYTHGEELDVLQHIYTTELPLPFRRNQLETLMQPLKEAIMLSVSARPHISELGLLEPAKTAPEAWINRLFYLALEKLIPLFDSFVETKYLTDILDGNINSSDSNCAYWRLQEQYLGIQPPVERSQMDFDVIATKLDGYEEGDYEDVFSKVLSFKIYEGLCKKAHKYTEGSSNLSECDLTGSKDVGNALIEKLSLGSKQPWQELLKYLTDDTEINGSSILKYFQPLQDWLEEYISKNGVYVGWEEANMCK